MTGLLANAGAMPARSPHLNLNLDSFRKLKSAFAAPLPRVYSRSLSQQTTLFSGDGGEEKTSRRLHVLSSFGGRGDEDEEERAGARSKQHYGTRNPGAEPKAPWTRPRPETGDVDSRRRQTKWTQSPERTANRQNFSSSRAALTKWTQSPERTANRQNFSSSRAAFGAHVAARHNGGGGAGRRRRGEVGNEGQSRSRSRNSGIQGYAENDSLVREEKRAAFESWALEKLREAGATALPAIEEMRKTFAPVSPRLVSSAGQPERNFAGQRNLNLRQTGGRSSLIGSAVVDVRNAGRTARANGGYGISRMGRRGSSSSPTGMSKQQSWSPKSSEAIRGYRSASNVASSAGVQFPAAESGKTTRDESSSASKPGGESIPEPLLVKRKTKFPINFYGRAGTVMLVDKPQGWTSFAVCAKLRHLLKIQKVGHAGTLDPMATGLLIVCLGRATKLADSFQAMTKVYSGTLRLGELTPSLDADTEVSDLLPWEHITDDQLEQAKQDFVGDIFQTPPMYSAIKIDGERLYVKARKGEQIEVPARLVTVTDFQLERSPENRQDIHFKVTCSKGTYIRSLCADLARAVGSYAHLIALRRERIGKYSVKDSWPILDFVEQYSQAREPVAIPGKH